MGVTESVMLQSFAIGVMGSDYLLMMNEFSEPLSKFLFMKNEYRLRLLVVTVFAIFSLAISSCSSDDDMPQPTITVNGASGGEHTFPGAFDNGKSGIDYRQVFKISSNVEWALNGKVDWLNITPMKGSGEVELAVYPTTENKSDEPREAILVLSSSEASVSIRIVQEGKYVECYVVPTNDVALYNCFCWEYNASPNVNTFQYILLSENEFKRMTDNELMEEIMNEDVLKYDDGWLSVFGTDYHGNYIEANSNYYFVSLATDKEGNKGALKKIKFKTPEYLDADEDAYVSYTNFSYSSYGFEFDAVKEGYCDSYHIVYGVNSEKMNSAVYAFEINYFIKNKVKHWLAKNDYYEWDIVLDYPNNHTFSYSNYLMSYYPICFGYGWGVFRDGRISSDLIGFQVDTSSESAPQMRTSGRSVADVPETITIKKSEFLERAKNLCK